MLDGISSFISKVIRGEKVRIGDTEARWKKVSELTEGMLIAVPKSLPDDFGSLGSANNTSGVAGWSEAEAMTPPMVKESGSGTDESDVLWDEIVSIKRLSLERVYDIEVEGTHNFVAGNFVDAPRPDNSVLLHDEPLRGPPEAKLKIKNLKLKIGQKWYGGFFAHNTYISTNLGIGSPGDSSLASAPIYLEGSSGDLNTYYGGFGKYQNMLTYSEAFDNAAWTKTTVTVAANSVAAPNTTTTADTLTASAANGTVAQPITGTAASYTFSVYLKRLTGTGAISVSADGTNFTTCTINSTTYTRCSDTRTLTAASYNQTIKIATNTDAIYAWGAQTELASAMNQYAATSALAVGTSTSVGFVTNGNGPNQFAFGGAGIPILSMGDTANTSKVSLRLSGGSVSNQLEIQSASGIINLGDNSVNHRLDIYNSGNTVNISLDANSGNPTYFNAGGVAIGQTSVTAGYKLDVNGKVNIAGDGSGDAFLVVGGGTGKINVGTIDPPYTINGEKFATYLSGMTGIKEETSGTVETNQYIPNIGYAKVLDFNTLEKGSDLWLFSKVTDLRQNIDKMVVLLTPSTNTKTWYAVDKSKFRLTVYSTQPASVAYRLTAPRFDSDKWNNTRTDDTGGFILNDNDQISQVSLDNGGNLSSQYVPKLSDFRITAPSANQFNLLDQSGHLITDLGLYSEAAIANLKTGFISAKQIVSDLSNIGNLKVDEKIVSPVIETDKLITKDIEASGSAKFGELIVQNQNKETVASIDSSGNATFSGQLSSSSLSVSDLSNLGNLEVSGDATISGILHADRIQSADLETLRSSFGDLIDKVASLQGQLATPSAQLPTTHYQQSTIIPTDTPTPSPTLTPTPAMELTPAPTIESIIQNPPSPIDDTSTESAALLESSDADSLLARLSGFLTRSDSIRNRIDSFLASSSVATSSASPPLEFSQDYQLPSDLSLNTLKVIESASLPSTSVAGSLLVDATLLLENNRISSLTDSLSLSAVNDVNFFGGKMIVDAGGNLSIQGTLIAQGGIITNEISPNNGDLTINLASQGQPLQEDTRIGGFGQLLIKGGEGKTVASIDASGSAKFNNLIIKNLTVKNDDETISSASGQLILTAADNFLQNGVNAPALRSTSSAGEATLPAGALDLYIYNPNLSDKTLVYITPTSPTQNRTLYVSRKDSCPIQDQSLANTNCHPHFVISLDTPVTFDIKFNWWIIN